LDTIIVPSDKSNYDRAINLLKEHGMDDANVVEVEAQNIPLMLSDCAFAVINGNYALSAGVVNRCLITEEKDSEIAQRMANIIAVKAGNENKDKTGVLIEALSQENIREFIENNFGDSVIYLG
jgi:D-methionine transport system substrate-binding protein